MKYSIVFLAAITLTVLAFGLNRITPNGFTEEFAAPSNESTYETDFDKMMAVLTHKRCVNCHPAGDRPLQGEDSHIHLFDVQRGKANHGLEATTCNTCHQSENNNFSGVPGAPEWSLAPLSMAWEGLTRTEIAASMLDRSRNGDRSYSEIEHHLTEHALVLWAFDPGLDAEGNPREKPPVSKQDYIEAVHSWFKDGAKIPEE